MSEEPEARPTDLHPTGEITRTLRGLEMDGDGALDRLIPMVYDELRRIAGACFREERRAVTLQPTALINEVYLRLLGHQKLSFRNRAHFFRFAGTVMRRILVDHARARRTAKRGADRQRVPVREALQVMAGDKPLDPAMLIALDEALDHLAQRDSRQAQIVSMRFFAGLRIHEVADVFEVSTTIITREWSIAKAWLARELAR